MSFLIIIFLHDFIVNLFQLEEVASFLLLIPLAILFGGFLQVVEQWLIRTKQFRVSAQTAVSQSILINGEKQELVSLSKSINFDFPYGNCGWCKSLFNALFLEKVKIDFH